MERCWSADPSERPSFTDIAERLRSMAASIPAKRTGSGTSPEMIRHLVSSPLALALNLPYSGYGISGIDETITISR